MKTNLFGTALSCLALTAAANGGTFLEEILSTTDAGTGISSSKTYTHAVDWGTDAGDPGGPGSIVNGVTFGEGGTTGSNYSILGTPNVFQNNGTNYDAGSGMNDMTEDFIFGGGALQTLTLTGLIGGATYTFSEYLSNGWNGATQTLDGDDDGVGFGTQSFDRGDGGSPKAIRYTYTQAAGDTDFQMTFQADNNADGFHHYGFTNEVVALPEPASLGLLAVAGVGLLMRRRRA